MVADSPLGRSHGHHRAVLVTVSGQVLRPSPGSSYWPLTVWTHETDRVTDAYALECRLHGWSRKKKEALIRGDFNVLPGLASRRGGRPRGA